MPGPLYNAIKGTSSGAAGTGAFTPSAASSGFLAWSTVYTGWIGLVRFEDGTDWELCYCYWNGTTLSRSATQDVASSTGSILNLTSAATAAMVGDANIFGLDFLRIPARGVIAISSSATAPTAIGAVAFTAAGTIGSAALGTGSYLARQPRVLYTSATTANAQAGLSTTNVFTISGNTSGVGGWAFGTKFGCSGIPTGPRIFAGLTSATYAGSTAEPSALTAHMAILGLDSTDTNMQVMVNSGVGTATKTDTGIPFAANGWYEFQTWANPGSTTVFYLVIRWDTGAIFYGSTSTDVPNGGNLFPQVLGALSATTGTAIVPNIGHILVRAVM